jgi:mannitol-1-phosphate 5-dehydrogenase
LEEHVDDLIYRFRNISLGDTIFRVGCDLYRKLGPEDRIVAPIRAAIKMGKPFDLILKTLYAGMSFKAKDEKGNHFPDDILFFEEVKKGQTHILSSVCKLPDLNGKDIIVNIFTA